MAMSSTHEIGERRMIGKEKNPKQVLIDWVMNVQHAASSGHNIIYANNGFTKEEKLRMADEWFNRILGQCETMMTVLKNSD